MPEDSFPTLLHHLDFLFKHLGNRKRMTSTERVHVVKQRYTRYFSQHPCRVSPVRFTLIRAPWKGRR